MSTQKPLALDDKLRSFIAASKDIVDSLKMLEESHAGTQADQQAEIPSGERTSINDVNSINEIIEIAALTAKALELLEQSDSQ